ncbi:MAG: histidine ammonia-lyase [Saprospiraceae bacterium]|nr:histidine ammonia-lyase [Candidatus Brachybacter algidus]
MKISIDASISDLEDHQIIDILDGNCNISISDNSWAAIDSSFQYLQHKISSTDTIMYGINTGFGSLRNVGINDEDIEDLQVNLIRSHACGAGAKVPISIARLILFLKVRSLSYGYSGVSKELVQRLINMFNDDVIPVMYEQGSLGASGDLAPLAHLSLPLIGEGAVYSNESIMDSAEYLRHNNLKPYVLKAKEGLALINGTQFSLAYLQASYVRTRQLLRAANVTAAMSIEGFNCRLEPFHEAIHSVRPGNGQPEIATFIRELLHDSAHMSEPKVDVQDPYSFRCIPQVHGATMNALNHIGQVIANERNSVTDNPNIFVEEDMVISGGNFHAQPLAFASDYLCLAAAELGSISERRLYLLISGLRGLEPFLTTKPGLQSGFMIAQYTAASIVSMNKQLASPSSVDSIISSNGQEDHVSMAANAGVKVWQIVNNVATVLAIEWQAAAQAVEMKDYPISSKLRAYLKAYRKHVSFLDQDRPLQPDFEKTKAFFNEINWFA